MTTKWRVLLPAIAVFAIACPMNSFASSSGAVFLQEDDRSGGVAERDDEEEDGEEQSDERKKEKKVDPNLVAAFPSDLATVGLDNGDLIPEIEGKDFEGTKFKLSDYEGKVIMLDFWGDW